MNDKLAVAIHVVNFVKTSLVKSRLFTAQSKDMDADMRLCSFTWLFDGYQKAI